MLKFGLLVKALPGTTHCTNAVWSVQTVASLKKILNDASAGKNTVHTYNWLQGLRQREMHNCLWTANISGNQIKPNKYFCCTICDRGETGGAKITQQSYRSLCFDPDSDFDHISVYTVKSQFVCSACQESSLASLSEYFLFGPHLQRILSSSKLCLCSQIQALASLISKKKTNFEVLLSAQTVLKLQGFGYRHSSVIIFPFFSL